MVTQLNVEAPRHTHPLHLELCLWYCQHFSATSTTIYPAADRCMDRMIHDTCAWARSEHPGPGPIIPSFPPQTSILRFPGLPPDDLLTESTIRSFNRLFASPVCGLAWRKGLHEGDNVVGDEGASYDMAGWEHSALSPTQELPSEGSDTTDPPSARSHAWAPTQPIDPGMRAGTRILLHPHALKASSTMLAQMTRGYVHHTRLHTLSHLTVCLSLHREPPALLHALRL
ncbi:hypothetical protein EDB83DRAFT_2363277 [Lactarius deliciosus]|nr:hypothetical protein EDB83DRAFT_2363277 [Lactarius deliciosus]